MLGFGLSGGSETLNRPSVLPTLKPRPALRILDLQAKHPKDPLFSGVRGAVQRLNRLRPGEPFVSCQDLPAKQRPLSFTALLVFVLVLLYS